MLEMWLSETFSPSDDSSTPLTFSSIGEVAKSSVFTTLIIADAESLFPGVGILLAVHRV